MKKRERKNLPVFGGSSLLTIFGVLVLTIFALLSLTAALADRRLSEAAAEAVTAYYEADLEAERIFACLRNGLVPETVTEEQGRYSYACPVSRYQTLQVELEKTEDSWVVLRWQTVAHPEDGEEILPVWNGK